MGGWNDAAVPVRPQLIERMMTTPDANRRPLPIGVLAAIVGLALGIVMLQLVNLGLDLLWITLPEQWGTAPAWYVLGLLLAAGALVYLVRRFIGDDGHAPLGGIAVSPLTPRQYVGVILAILATLWGGAVLGPEVALVATGSMAGTVLANRFGITDAKDSTKVIGLGALGAILALFVGPLVTGSATVNGAPTAIEVAQLGWAIPVAIIATLAATLARLGAALVARAAGPRPHAVILIGAGAVVAVCALLMQAITGEPVAYVATSSEALISDLPMMTSTSALVAIICFKAIAYAVSLGAGFRGGPFFPAVFIGAAVGLLVALVLPTGPNPQAAIVVGVVAGVIATARMTWRVAILLGAGIGLAMGTWTLVPAAVIGAAVARAIPRLGDRVVVADHA